MSRYPSEIEIAPSGPVNGSVRPPGSKSITNRALLIAGLAEGHSRLTGVLEADDTGAMVSALRMLGVEVRRSGDEWIISGRNGHLAAPDAPLDVRSSGTTSRFVAAAATLAAAPVTINGSAQLRRRPFGPLVDTLRATGIDVEYGVATGALPIRVFPGALPGGRLEVDARLTSQFASGLMMISPYAHNDTSLGFVDDVVASRSYLNTTAEVMRAFGARVEIGDRVEISSTHRYVGREYEIEADASAAVYPAVAAAITGGRVTIEGIHHGSTQSDLRVFEVLEAMGTVVKRAGATITVSGPEGSLRAVDIDMSQAPDGALAVAVAALFADGPTTLRGLSTLRHKETDRIAALAAELTKLGASVEASDDRIVVAPRALSGARIATYDDHRMAMAFALAGLVIPGVVIEDPGVVAKTWPGYWAALETLHPGSIVAGNPPTVVAVDGPGGVGKTTVSRAVAEALNLGHLDTGAFYRGATAAVLRRGVSISDPVAVVGAVESADLTYAEGRLYLGGEDISDEIRTSSVTSAVSTVAAVPEVREQMVALQRRWVARQPRGAVVEGRDIGTVVFPDADVKIFLTARPEVRAQRRAGEMPGADVTQIQQNLERRDLADSSRDVSPLRAAEDAHVIDTSDLDVDEVVASALSHAAAVVA